MRIKEKPMKKYIVLLLISIFVVTGCSKSSDDITMTIKEGTLTSTGATIIIKDTSGDENTFGDWYRIDKKENNIWIEQPPVIENYVFNLMGYLVDENNEVVLNTDWEWLYGRLPTGEYRIVKTMTDGSEIYAEFTIIEE